MKVFTNRTQIHLNIIFSLLDLLHSLDSMSFPKSYNKKRCSYIYIFLQICWNFYGVEGNRLTVYISYQENRVKFASLKL